MQSEVIKMKIKEKYSIDDLKHYPKEGWNALVGIMIANELKEINKLLHKMKRK